MTAIEIIAGTVAGIGALGAWLKFTTLPVIGAYRLGREAERIITRRAAKRAAAHQ